MPIVTCGIIVFAMSVQTMRQHILAAIAVTVTIVAMLCVASPFALFIGWILAKTYHLRFFASFFWSLAALYQIIAWRNINEATGPKYFNSKTGDFRPRVSIRHRSPARRFALIVTTILVVIGIIAQRYLP